MQHVNLLSWKEDTDDDSGSTRDYMEGRQMMTVEAQETTWKEDTDDDSGSTRDYMEGRHR